MSEGKAKIQVERTEGDFKGFQSKEAREVTLAKPKAADDEEPKSAIVDGDLDDVMGSGASGQMKPVKVRARSYIEPFRFGPNTYTLPAGKEVLVPLAVKQHLEEKGLL